MAAQKTEIGKKILGLFVQFDGAENAGQQSPEKAPAAPPSAPVSATSPPVANTPAPLAGGAVNEQIARSLSAALEEANIEGFDYFEYAKTIDALRPTIPSEMTLFQTAFATGTVMGATKKKLLDSADVYMRALELKEREFKEEVRSRTNDTVLQREKEAQDIDTTIAQKNAEIQKITNEINQLAERKNRLVSEIAENRSKIEKVNADFASTLAAFTGKIRADKERIDKYINPPPQ